MALLFLESWQHECCGDPFEVGDAVAWPVAPVEAEGLVPLLGAALGRQVHLSVERHGDEVGTLGGTVRSVRAVFHRFEPVREHPDGTYRRGLPGSGQLRHVRRTRQGERLDDLEWAGYLVEVAVDVQAPGAVPPATR